MQCNVMYVCMCLWLTCKSRCLVGHIFLLLLFGNFANFYMISDCTVKHYVMVDQVSFEIDISRNEKKKTWFGFIWLVTPLKSSYSAEPAWTHSKQLYQHPYLLVLCYLFSQGTPICKYSLADWHTYIWSTVLFPKHVVLICARRMCSFGSVVRSAVPRTGVFF